MTYEPENRMGDYDDEYDERPAWQDGGEEPAACDCFVRFDMLSDKPGEVSVAWHCPVCGVVNFDRRDAPPSLWGACVEAVAGPVLPLCVFSVSAAAVLVAWALR